MRDNEVNVWLIIFSVLCFSVRATSHEFLYWIKKRKFNLFETFKKYQGVKNFTLVARLGEKCNISCISL